MVEVPVAPAALTSGVVVGRAFVVPVIRTGTVAPPNCTSTRSPRRAPEARRKRSVAMPVTSGASVPPARSRTVSVLDAQLS